MGAGASVSEVSETIDGLGSGYHKYAEKASEMGVNGELIAGLESEAELDEALDEMGVTSKLQRKRLKLEMKNSSGQTEQVVSGGFAAGATAGVVQTSVVEAIPVGTTNRIHAVNVPAPIVTTAVTAAASAAVPVRLGAGNAGNGFVSPMASGLATPTGPATTPTRKQNSSLRRTPSGRLLLAPETRAEMPEGLPVTGKILLGLGWTSPGSVVDVADQAHIDMDVGLVALGKVST